MKVLFDSCVSYRAAQALGAEGHETEWVGGWDSDPGDEAILQHAIEHGQVLITLDGDFGKLAVETARRHWGIVRLVEIPDHRHADYVRQVLAAHASGLLAGALLTVEIARVRIRPAEGSEPDA